MGASANTSFGGGHLHATDIKWLRHRRQLESWLDRLTALPIEEQTRGVWASRHTLELVLKQMGQLEREELEAPCTDDPCRHDAEDADGKSLGTDALSLQQVADRARKIIDEWEGE